MHQGPNPFAYAKPITVESLADLFSHHRGLTGGWTMTSTPPEPIPPADPPAPPPAPPADPPAYTPPASQDELNRIIGDRVARERAKYADYDAVKAKADAHDKAVADAQTEQEKAVAAARKEGEEAAAQTGNARLIAAEARALAATWKQETDGVSAGFNVGPAAVVRLLDLAGVTIGADGVVDAEVLKAKLDKLAADEPGLIGSPIAVKKTPKPDRTQGGGGDGTGGKTRLTDLSGEELFDRLHPKKTA